MISFDSTSFGLIPEKARSTPSTSTNGLLDLLMDEPPRIRNTASAPGVLFDEYTRAPDILPFNPSSTVLIGISRSTSPSTLVIAEVMVRRDRNRVVAGKGETERVN